MSQREGTRGMGNKEQGTANELNNKHREERRWSVEGEWTDRGAIDKGKLLFSVVREGKIRRRASVQIIAAPTRRETNPAIQEVVDKIVEEAPDLEEPLAPGFEVVLVEEAPFVGTED